MIKREFTVTRTELQLHTGKVEVTAVEPKQVAQPSTDYESMFLYLEPTEDTIPMVGEILIAEVKGDTDGQGSGEGSQAVLRCQGQGPRTQGAPFRIGRASP